MSVFLANTKTTLLGVLVLICGGTNYSGILPEKYTSLLMMICAALTAFGLIAAKDADKSNAPSPTATPGTVTAVK